MNLDQIAMFKFCNNEFHFSSILNMRLMILYHGANRKMILLTNFCQDKIDNIRTGLMYVLDLIYQEDAG